MLNSLQLIDIIIIIGISQGVFLSLTLLRIANNNKLANRILALLLIIATFMLIGRFLFFRYLNLWVFQWSIWADALVFLFGPMLYTYVRRFLFSSDSKYWPSLLHFIPFIMMVVLSLFYVSYYSPEAYYQAFLANKMRIVFNIILILGIILNLSYLTRSFLLLKAYKDKEKASLSFNQHLVNYLLMFLSSIGLFMLVWMLTYINESLFESYFKYVNYNTVWLIIPIFIYVIGYFSLKQPELFRLPLTVETKKKKNRLSEEDSLQLKKRLDDLMTYEKIYLNSNLTLKDVAFTLETSTHNISWLLNNIYNTTFYDFVNSYRVKEFLNKVDNKEHLHHTILSLSMDAGFNSKSTFNKAFKLIMKETPSSYIKGVSTVQNM
ncbi:AraC family transcriptional regulator [uncultured Psychroserpens sp.]|uniref:helix-turn-helix domain-containing protein n=1 Tax=uncultured Psychroserpens sp. TaxID=255436 RepID=UPI00261FF38F|nr:AraC family transcriptional regulator [uncultured Psychroserpens sp.]